MADRRGRLRLFLAADVPEGHKRSIERATQTLRLENPDAKWVPRESWHVTLKFLGWVDDERLDEVIRAGRKAAADSNQVETRLTEMGAFPNPGRARVLWVALDDSSGELERLAGNLERRYAKRGFKKESRKYHPHLTLARYRLAREVALEEAGPYEFEQTPFSIESVVLYESHLSPRGSTYEVIEQIDLNRG